MKLIWKYVILISVLLNAYLLFYYIQSNTLDRTPPWHPFELNSDLSLESIVEDGYRFAGMPCGQVQYTKTLGDTTIQYEVEIDCKSYKGKYDYFKMVSDTAIIEPRLEATGSYEKNNEEFNPYYPWDPNEIKNCYQKIKWRVFTISLGNSIDSIFIESYIRSKYAALYEERSDWNTKRGGTLLIYHYESALYYLCHILNDNYLYPEDPKWEFTIISTIPALDQKSIIKEEEREQLIDKHFQKNE